MLDSYKIKKEEIKKRLEEFRKIPKESRIKEFIFCLLTPQSQAKKCWEAIEEIFSLPEKEKTENKINMILKRKTRFHNTKTKRVLWALENWEFIRKNLNKQNPIELRNWLAENVNGYGLKEAGHFMRNIGLSENKIAILDRHILRNLKKHKIINDEKIKNKKDYLEIEEKFKSYSEKIKIPIDELDLFWWSQENGEIFK